MIQTRSAPGGPLSCGQQVGHTAVAFASVPSPDLGFYVVFLMVYGTVWLYQVPS